MKRWPPRTAVHPDGFSLVEVAIAIAITAVAMTAVLGTWPSGQEHLRKAADMTMASQVSQRIAAELKQADFPDVLLSAGIGSASQIGALPRRYFSDTGREVTAGDASRAYEVVTNVAHSEQLPVRTANNPERWDAQGQLVITIEVAVSPPGAQLPVGADGLVNRAKWRRPVFAFPLMIGGNSTW
jgi:uncharacterized protein (TIGR02598 family)